MQIRYIYIYIYVLTLYIVPEKKNKLYEYMIIPETKSEYNLCRGVRPKTIIDSKTSQVSVNLTGQW